MDGDIDKYYNKIFGRINFCLVYGLHLDTCKYGYVYKPVYVLLLSEVILGLHPANERRHYEVTPSLIGWAQS